MDMDTFVPSVLQAEIGTALATEKENAEQLLLLNRLEAGTQVPLMTMSRPSLRACCSTSLLTTGYKRLTEGGCEAFAFWLLAFWMWEAFGWEDYWREITKGGK
jgi:hypothetical protein